MKFPPRRRAACKPTQFARAKSSARWVAGGARGRSDKSLLSTAWNLLHPTAILVRPPSRAIVLDNGAGGGGVVGLVAPTANVDVAALASRSYRAFSSRRCP